MKPVKADFRTQRGPGRLHWALAWALIAAAVVSLVDAGMAYQRRRAAQAIALEPVRQAESTATAAPEAKEYERSAREMLAAASVPWPQALTALEAVVVPGVTIRAVDVLATERMIHVEVEATTYAVLLRYVEDLNAGDGPTVWRLVSAELSEPKTASTTHLVQARIDGDLEALARAIRP